MDFLRTFLSTKKNSISYDPVQWCVQYFPEDGASIRGDTNLIFEKKNSKKLHENERNWTEEGSS